MSPLVTLLLRSIAGKAFQKAPEGSALNLMGTKMEKYDPISGIYKLFQNAPVIGEKIQGFKNAVAPMPYGTSQKKYNEYKGIFDSSSGLGSFGDLFNQNAYQQQMYGNLTPEGKAYANSLYEPGGALEGYNQFSAFGKGTLGTISNILAKNPNMSLARQNIYRTAADEYISGIDPTKQGIEAVTKPGTYSYDDAYINYAPPSGDGDSGGGWSGGSSDNWGGGFDSSQATL